MAIGVFVCVTLSIELRETGAESGSHIAGTYRSQLSAARHAYRAGARETVRGAGGAGRPGGGRGRWQRKGRGQRKGPRTEGGAMAEGGARAEGGTESRGRGRGQRKGSRAEEGAGTKSNAVNEKLALGLIQT